MTKLTEMKSKMKVTYDYHEIEINYEGNQYRVFIENEDDVVDIQRNIGSPDWNDYDDVEASELREALEDFARSFHSNRETW